MHNTHDEVVREQVAEEKNRAGLQCNKTAKLKGPTTVVTTPESFRSG